MGDDRCMEKLIEKAHYIHRICRKILLQISFCVRKNKPIPDFVEQYIEELEFLSQDIHQEIIRERQNKSK